MQAPLTVAPKTITLGSVVFPVQKTPASQTHLVAHWLKDAEGKLYQIWVSEKI